MREQVFYKILKIFLTSFFILVSAQVFAQTATVYFNGDILTMEGDKPQYVEAIVVKESENYLDALNNTGFFGGRNKDIISSSTYEDCNDEDEIKSTKFSLPYFNIKGVKD